MTEQTFESKLRTRCAVLLRPFVLTSLFCRSHLLISPLYLLCFHLPPLFFFLFKSTCISPSLLALMSHQPLFFLTAASTASGEGEGPDLLKSKWTFSFSQCMCVLVCVRSKKKEKKERKNTHQVKSGGKTPVPSVLQDKSCKHDETRIELQQPPIKKKNKTAEHETERRAKNFRCVKKFN